MKYVDPKDPNAWWNLDDPFERWWHDPSEDWDDSRVYLDEVEMLDELYKIQEQLMKGTSREKT